MNISNWVRDANTYLDELKGIDLGYPIGKNMLRPARPLSVMENAIQQTGLANRAGLEGFYRQCDGLNWPDVTWVIF